jgi:outer membrane protein
MKASLFTIVGLLSLSAFDASAQAPALSAGLPRSEAKIAFVDLERVAATSALGKAAAAQIETLQGRKATEVGERQKQLQALQVKLTDGASVLGADALSKLDSEVARARRDLERFTQDAQQEVQDYQVQIQRSFAQKLFPVIGQIAETKDLWAVFRIEPQNLVWYQKALDISDDVIARLDAPAAAVTPAKPPKD